MDPYWPMVYIKENREYNNCVSSSVLFLAIRKRTHGKTTAKVVKGHEKYLNTGIARTANDYQLLF